MPTKKGGLEGRLFLSDVKFLASNALASIGSASQRLPAGCGLAIVFANCPAAMRGDLIYLRRNPNFRNELQSEGPSSGVPIVHWGSGAVAGAGAGSLRRLRQPCTRCTAPSK